MARSVSVICLDLELVVVWPFDYVTAGSVQIADIDSTQDSRSIIMPGSSCFRSRVIRWPPNLPLSRTPKRVLLPPCAHVICQKLGLLHAQDLVALYFQEFKQDYSASLHRSTSYASQEDEFHRPATCRAENCSEAGWCRKETGRKTKPRRGSGRRG